MPSSDDLAAAARAMLIRDGRVALPGIGTLELVRQHALVSRMEGKARPPGATARLNTNLVADDGRLREAMGEEAFADALSTLRAAVTSGQSVDLPGVGSLFKDAAGRLRLRHAAGNLAPDAFGLPVLAVRSPARVPPLAEPVPQHLPVRPTARRAGRSLPLWTNRVPLRRPLWLLLALVGILLFAFLLYTLLLPRQDTQTARLSFPMPAQTITPPPEPPAEIEPKRAIVAIGLYGRQRNVNKQVGRLEAAGYTPHVKREGRNTRVGVEITYRQRTELLEALRDIQQRFTEDAFVLLDDGELRRPE